MYDYFIQYVMRGALKKIRVIYFFEKSMIFIDTIMFFCYRFKVEYFLDYTRELAYIKQDTTVCKVINLFARC